MLTSGTLLAQALPLLLYPVFTRLYQPEQFGIFATLSLFATVAALLASGTYETAVLIARSRREASHLIAYLLARSGAVLAALFLVAVVLRWGLPPERVAAWLHLDTAVVLWLPSVPLAAAGIVLYAAYAEWCVRSRYFTELSKARIWQTSAIALGRLALAFLTPQINGFVAGDVAGKASSALRCARTAWRLDRAYVFIHTLERMRAVAQRYAHVARYSLPDQLINNLAGSIHVLFLGAAFGSAELGYVTLVLSVLYLPVTVVSSAVKDVFRQRASVEYVRDGTCRPTYRRLLLPLTGLAVVGFGTLYVASPWLFPFVLGSRWDAAGEYARILTPLFFTNFVSMSLGGVLVIAERTDVSLVWQIVNLLLTVGALVIGTRVLQTMTGTLWCFTIARGASYLLYMGLSYHYAERPTASAGA